MSQTDETADIFDVISEEVDHVLPQEKVENTETDEAKTAEVETKTEDVVTEETAGTDETAKTGSTESTESEPLKTETQTEAEVIDWRATLPPRPQTVEIVPPTPDENGQVDPQAYETYLIGKAEQQMTEKMYDNYVENVALAKAEEILPEIKTNAQVRQLVENQRIAQIVSGQPGDAVSAAQAIKQLLGGAKAEGANNAKASITIQKAAAVETGASTTKAEPSKGDKIAERINLGDEDAFIELLDVWQEEGYL